MTAEKGHDRTPKRERAIVLHPQVAGAFAARDPLLRLEEAAGLAEALDLDVADRRLVPVRRAQPGTFFGSGRVEALKAELAAAEAGVLIVDGALSPVQQRNLERAVQAKVVDRTGLILEIFGRRARTREGRLQVELARQGYERSRLVRTWTHLERQRGGLGKTGGPGETQLELDRRMIAARIDKLKAELEDVRRTRGLQRAARRRAGYPTVALVGYTNAGKSTLFNRLTEAGVLAKNMPFATLDPTARLVRAPSGRNVILSDTVGFITDLPLELVAAFRATLEEVTEADLLLHVRDIAHVETDAQRDDVLHVLAQLREEAGPSEQPIIEVWNKIDLLPDAVRAARLQRARGEVVAPASAMTGEGVEALLALVDRMAHGPTQTIQVSLDPAEGRLRAEIAAKGRILEESLDEEGRLRIIAEMTAEAADQFSRSGLFVERLAAQ